MNYKIAYGKIETKTKRDLHQELANAINEKNNDKIQDILINLIYEEALQPEIVKRLEIAKQNPSHANMETVKAKQIQPKGNFEMEPFNPQKKPVKQAITNKVPVSTKAVETVDKTKTLPVIKPAPTPIKKLTDAFNHLKKPTTNTTTKDTSDAFADLKPKASKPLENDPFAHLKLKGGK